MTDTTGQYGNYLVGQQMGRDAIAAAGGPVPDPRQALPVGDLSQGNPVGPASGGPGPSFGQTPVGSLHDDRQNPGVEGGGPAATNPLEQIADQVASALNQGESKDIIGDRLVEAAAQTRDQYGRQALFELGTALLSGSNDNISRMLSKMTPGSGQVGADVVDPLGAAAASSGRLNLQGQDAAKAYDDQLAGHKAQRQEMFKARAASLTPDAMSNIHFTDDDGNLVSLADVKTSDPKLYQDVRKFLATADDEQIQNFISDSQVSGLPGTITGLETAAPDVDWSNPIIKDAAQLQSFKSGLSENELQAVGNDSWSTVSNYQTKGLVPNPNYGVNGDTRNYVNLKAPSEGLGRSSGFANNLIGSELVTSALSQTFNPATGDINRWNVTLQSVPTADQQIIRSAHSMLNLLQASGITGLAGVETLTEYLDQNAASPDVLANSENLRQYYSLVLENVADIAYGNLDKNTPLSPEVAYIKKHGGKAFIDNVLASQSAGDVTVLNGKYYSQNSAGEWIELGG